MTLRSAARMLSVVARRADNLFYLLSTPDGIALRRSNLDAKKVHSLRELAEAYCGPISRVLDVGGHEGAYVRLFAAAFPEARIDSFEPVGASFKQLQRVCSEYRGRAFAHKLALGADTGEAALEVNAFTAASSTFPPTHLHEAAFPVTGGSRRIELAEMATLDSWAVAHAVDRVDVLKIDVQGGELAVIRGGSETLQRTSLVVVELSLAELYEGAPRLPQVVDALGEVELEFVDLFGELRDPRNGRLLQLDGVFARA